MLILPSKPKGEILIQPSKSYLHRLIIMGALSGDSCTIENINTSDDIAATLGGLKTLGLCDYKIKDDLIEILPGDGVIKGEVDCGESGSTLRFLIPIALTLGEEVTFIGKGRLLERPETAYVDLARKFGFTFEETDEYIRVKGALTPGVYSVEGSVTSQFVSGLSLALSKIEEPSTIKITNQLVSSGYVRITMDVLTSFGINAVLGDNTVRIDGNITPVDRIVCPNDWSHGANFACWAAASGNITIKGLDRNSLQPDREIIDVLIKMGASIVKDNDEYTFYPGILRPIDVDGHNIPDIIPALAVVMGTCMGRSTIVNIERLRTKESDRITATVDLINAIGGCAIEGNGEIIIEGTGGYVGGKVNTHGDHRIAMAAAVASSYSKGPIEIDNSQCVNKSAPEFWNEFSLLCGKTEDTGNV